MCFIEFVGYTCGHTSMPVLRACPLTTASHTFPTCPRRGDKAFFAGEMCSACQRIIHSRATQIEEYEHRFMHERGVCGCETVFPYLIRPRAIGSCGGGGCADEEFGCGGLGEQQDEQETHSCNNGTPLSKVELPPLLCEATDDGGRAVVSVRLPSLYAAEWVADHRARHDDGLCDCRVDFRTYPGVMMDGVTDDDVAKATHQHMKHRQSRPIRRVSSMSAMSAMSRDAEEEDDGDEAKPKGRTRSSSYSEFSHVDSDGVGRSNDGNELGETRENTAVAIPSVEEARRRPLLRPHPGQPVRHAGAVFAKVPEYLKLMGPFLARPSPSSHESDQQPVFDGIFAAGGGKMRRKGAPPVSTVVPPGAALRRSRAKAARDYHAYQASQTTPLVGFPIGAGPEGVSHAIPWRNRPRCWIRS